MLGNFQNRFGSAAASTTGYYGRLSTSRIFKVVVGLCVIVFVVTRQEVNQRNNALRATYRTFDDHSLPWSIASTFPPPALSELKHLVLVPGHAIWHGCDPSLSTNDSEWILEDLQKGGDVRTYIKHIAQGAQIAVQDPEALLIFSGGMTRPHTDSTEASSYYRLAKSGNVFALEAESLRQAGEEVQAIEGDFERVTTEDYALDSYENLLFSIARFKEFAGRYPEFITVVGYGMKRKRYDEVHRAALLWPSSHFNYISIDNDHDVAQDYVGERKFGLVPWQADRYGCKGDLLAKRRRRNPFRRVHSYHTSASELIGLMEYCPTDNQLYKGGLPWRQG